MHLVVLRKLVYSKSADLYEQHLDELKSLKLRPVTDYFMANWHPCRHEWSMGLIEGVSYLNLTNNRLESLNQKFKSVCTNYSNLNTSFNEILTVISCLRLERNNRAATVAEKVPIATLDNTLSKYQQLVTPYALRYIKEQYGLSDKYDIASVAIEGESYHIPNTSGVTKTNDSDCTCFFRKSMKLPCRHIFAVRRYENKSLYEPSLVTDRWLMGVFKRNSLFLMTTANSNSTNNLTHSVIDKKKTKLTTGMKLKQAREVCDGIISSTALVGTRHFNYYIDLLKKVRDAITQQHNFAVIVYDESKYNF